MKNQVTEQDITEFMSLKKPQRALGFFSDGYSGDKQSFIKGLEGEMEGNFTGYIVILDKPSMQAAVVGMKKAMEEKHEEMAESDFENFLAVYGLEGGKYLMINAEFGSSDELCSDLQELTHDEGFSFDEAHLTSEELSQYLSSENLILPDEYKNALDALQKS